MLAANDADAAALGEHTAGHPDARALCLVKVSTGIGTGIVIDGRIYRGADGGAGDVGHVGCATTPTPAASAAHRAALRPSPAAAPSPVGCATWVGGLLRAATWATCSPPAMPMPPA